MNNRPFLAALVSLVVSFTPSALLAQPAAPAADGERPLSSGPTWRELETTNAELPPVRVEPPVLDFGDQPVDTVVSGSVRLVNTSDKRLVIQGMTPTCRCTVASIESTTIEPGQSINVTINFDSGPYIHVARRDIPVRFAGYSRMVAMRVAAIVHYGVRAEVRYDPPEQRRIGAVRLESPGGEAFSVLSANLRPPVFLDGFDPERDDPRATYTIEWDLGEYEPEKIPSFFVIETDHPTAPIIDLPVENPEFEPVRMPQPWSFGLSRVLLGRMDPMTYKDVVVTMSPFTTSALDAIQEVFVDPPVAEARVMGTEVAQGLLRVRLRILPEASVRGALFASVRLSAAEHQSQFWIMGRVATDVLGTAAGPDALPPGAEMMGGSGTR